MAEPLNRQLLIDQVRQSLQGTAKNAVHKVWGPEGPPWGTSFTDLEELAVQIGQIVASEVLQQALAAQSQHLPAAPLPSCPTCAGPLQDLPPEPRSVHTRAGLADWQEPARHCPRCRRDFFPSE
jgi:hypothetical protein